MTDTANVAWTKGPWRTELDNVFAGPIDNAIYVADCDPMRVGGVDGHPVCIANAILIASAPELLEALESIAQMTDADDPESYRADDREGCLETVFSVARKAIAKARGEGL